MLKYVYFYLLLLFLLLAGIGFMLSPSLAHADVVYECTLQDGSKIYTNHPPKGATCTRIRLPQVSEVPSYPATMTVADPLPASPQVDEVHEYPLDTDIRGGFAMHPGVGHNVAAQVCDLYGKWMDLSLKTRGGLYYDPLMAPMIQLFGGGFIPMECRGQ